MGHGELNDAPRGKAESEGRTAAILKLLLQKQNIVVKDLGLAQGLANDVPDDADAVFVLGPSDPFAPDATVCWCNGVTVERITGEIADGADTIECIGAKTRAGTGCGGCKGRISELIARSGALAGSAAGV